MIVCAPDQERWRGGPAKKNAFVRVPDRQRFRDLKSGETEGELFPSTSPTLLNNMAPKVGSLLEPKEGSAEQLRLRFTCSHSMSPWRRGDTVNQAWLWSARRSSMGGYGGYGHVAKIGLGPPLGDDDDS
jgi:hypothetical protein